MVWLLVGSLAVLFAGAAALCVAARLGVNLTTVYMAKDRVKKMLREEMDLAGLEGERLSARDDGGSKFDSSKADSAPEERVQGEQGSTTTGLP